MHDSFLKRYKRQKQGQCSVSHICHLCWQQSCLTSQTSRKSPSLTKPSWRRPRQKRRTLCPPKRVSVCYITAFGVSNRFGCGVGLSFLPIPFSSLQCSIYLLSLFIVLFQQFLSLPSYIPFSVFFHSHSAQSFLSWLCQHGCQLKVLHQHCSADLSVLAEFPMWISILFAIKPRSRIHQTQLSLKKIYWHNKGIYSSKAFIFHLFLFSAIEQERKGDATPWPKRQEEDKHKTCSSDMADITIHISV